MNGLKRLVFGQTSIYIQPERPDWLVPNSAGDRLLSGRSDKTPESGSIIEEIRRQQFLSLLPAFPESNYTGRSDSLTLNRLEECWLHITDRCNLGCSHCLFACSKATRKTMPLESAADIFDQAYRLGARIFYLTGGEPLVHPDFFEICRLIVTGRPDTRLVILTNGILLPHYGEFLKSLPADRIYLQISIDGLEPAHDAIRGHGSFRKLTAALDAVSRIGTHNTLAMTVATGNLDHMADIVRLAADFDIPGVHYLWLMVTGNAGSDAFVHPENLFDGLMAAAAAADKEGITIDNLENMASRVFSTPGTKYDLGNAGWTSLAAGPDGSIYPTPALIGEDKVHCGHMSEGLENVWKKSARLREIRQLSLIQAPAYAENPLRFIVGGGDIDHSYYAGGRFIGHDPYIPLYNRMALWLIHRAARQATSSEYPGIIMKMGDRLRQCHQDGQGVALTHSNCVLTLSDTRRVVGDFYTRAADTLDSDIINPVCYPEKSLSHVPEQARIRSYGCGSPVIDAAPAIGETVVDLGSGAGLECFIAARQVGEEGKVIGIDMIDHMLARARESLSVVAKNLGYDNVCFKKGYLEEIPLPDQTADVIISNCVINLSEDKRRTFSEMMRVLAPGGRIVVSDVVTDTPVPPAISNDRKLRGECIAGAMDQPHLMAMLEGAGFGRIQIIKRFFYREVENHPFYSLTYCARKPREAAHSARLIYPGPYAAAITDDGELLVRGQVYERPWAWTPEKDDSIILLDDQGNAANSSAQNSCACYTSPQSSPAKSADAQETEPKSAGVVKGRHRSDCMRCGRLLTYLEKEEIKTCVFCGAAHPANAVCEAGHFVCDACHSRDAADIVRQVCLNSKQTRMIELLDAVRSHPAFPVHGPEHHFAVPAVIVAAYRNMGGHVTDDDIVCAIDRGRAIPGGTCAFWGACGAALGVGIAFGIILQANPFKPEQRQAVGRAVGKVMDEIAGTRAARCCRRETYTALIKVAELSSGILPVPLEAGQVRECRQQTVNRECIGRECPYFTHIRLSISKSK